MKLTTLDLYQIDKCSKRWAEDTFQQEEGEPTRALIKKIFLTQAIGRNSSWTFDGIASAWEKIFWPGKEITRDSMQESVQGILATRKLYNRLPKDKTFKVYSTQMLTTSLDAGDQIMSSGDFLLSYKDRHETWIYLNTTPKEMRRSPLPMLENYLVQQMIREPYQKPFYIVVYYSSTKRKRIIHFKIRNKLSLNQNRKIILNLTEKAKRGISYPSIGEHCKKCSLKC